MGVPAPQTPFRVEKNGFYTFFVKKSLPYKIIQNEQQVSNGVGQNP
jgi:hypothetical protein